jgi:hypothetical protein
MPRTASSTAARTKLEMMMALRQRGASLWATTSSMFRTSLSASRGPGNGPPFATNSPSLLKGGRSAARCNLPARSGGPVGHMRGSFRQISVDRAGQNRIPVMQHRECVLELPPSRGKTVPEGGPSLGRTSGRPGYAIDAIGRDESHIQRDAPHALEQVVGDGWKFLRCYAE